MKFLDCWTFDTPGFHEIAKKIVKTSGSLKNSSVACVAGGQKAAWEKKRKGAPFSLARPTRSRTPKFPLPLPLLTPGHAG